ncbi:MAG: RNA polymerase sigma factor [Myxococcaceae bacterium]|nr:RNA polymerase sigma factor [Myxococcaceae bacterium]
MNTAVRQSSEVPQVPSDEQLVERVLAGDSAVFEILMRRNNPRLYRALRALLRDEAEVEDAMQATYLRAYDKLGSFRGTARFATWLTQVALNEGLGRLRHRRRHEHVGHDFDEELTMSPVATAPLTPEAVTGHRELVALLERAIDSLPELYRVVVMLRDVEGLDTGEAAEVLAVSEDVVKTRLSRARAALRLHFEAQLGSATAEAFGFHASRCDRVVAAVLARLPATRPQE